MTTSCGRGFAGLVLILVAVGLSGCSYRVTSVHQVDVAGLSSAHLSRTALAGLIIRSNYALEAESSGNTEQRRTFVYTLGPADPDNPLAAAPEWADTRSLFRGSDRFDGTGYSQQKYKAKTLLEAYCAARNDLEPIRYFEQQPTGLGRARFIAERNAVADSLAMVAHAYVDRSLRKHLADADGPIGDVMPHRQVLSTLAAAGAEKLYDRVMEQVQTTGDLVPTDCRALCRILGVEALMFVAVSYDYVSVLQSSQYGPYYTEVFRAETDAVVFGDCADQALARVGFNKVYEDQFEALDGVGRSINSALRGDLDETSAASLDRKR